MAWSLFNRNLWTAHQISSTKAGNKGKLSGSTASWSLDQLRISIGIAPKESSCQRSIILMSLLSTWNRWWRSSFTLHHVNSDLYQAFKESVWTVGILKPTFSEFHLQTDPNPKWFNLNWHSLETHLPLHSTWASWLRSFLVVRLVSITNSTPSTNFQRHLDTVS